MHLSYAWLQIERKRIGWAKNIIMQHLLTYKFYASITLKFHVSSVNSVLCQIDTWPELAHIYVRDRRAPLNALFVFYFRLCQRIP